ncbi:MAG: hypothetical protein ACPG4R_05005 [Glaciecola sp.]|jgi:hypothetical protein
MQFSLLQQIRTSEVVALFKDVFSASEGDAEGQLIADFVSKLMAIQTIILRQVFIKLMKILLKRLVH